MHFSKKLNNQNQEEKMEKIRLGFVPAQRDPFDENWALKMKQRVLKALDPVCKEKGIEIIYPDESLTKRGLVRDDEDAKKILKLFREKDVDGIVIGTMTFGDELSAIYAAQNMPGIPVLLFGTKEGPFTEDGNRRSDSFCGTLSVASGLYRRKIPFTFLGIVFPEEEIFSEKIVNFARVCSIVRGFKGARIGLVGPRPEQFETCAINEHPLIERFNQRIIQISMADIFSRANSLKGKEEISRVVNEIKERTNWEEVSEETLDKAARLEIVLKNFAQERNLSGMGIQCWPAMEEIYGISPCFTLGRLTEQGIMASCEVDIHGALTMLVQYLAHLKRRVPHFIDFTIQHQSRENTFLAWHCGNAPWSLAAEGCPIRLRPHSIQERVFGREKTMGTGEFQLKSGEITINRLVEYDGKFKMLITKGRIIPSKDNLRGSWSWVEVPDLDKLYRTLVEEGFIHHASIIHGDISEIIAEFCKFMNIQTIIV